MPPVRNDDARTLSSPPDSTHIGAHGEAPRSPTSGQAFEERPGQADPRQGVAAGCAGARRFAGGPAQPGHRPGPRRLGSQTGAPPRKTGQPPSLRRRRTIPGTAAAISPMRTRRAPRRSAGSASGRSRAMPARARRARSRSGRALGYGGSDPSKPLIGQALTRRKPPTPTIATSWRKFSSASARSAIAHRRSR